MGNLPVENKFRHFIIVSVVIASLITGVLVMTWLNEGNKAANGEACGKGSIENTSHYITMPDGVRIAADIWVPDGCSGVSYPAIVTFTRYWRAFDLDGEVDGDADEFLKYFTDAGYGIIRVDVRGSGASFGARATEFSVAEVNDYRHIVDWIADQSWSNGKVASYGVSYSGNTSELALIDPSSALKAAVPRFTDYDWYSSILFPGGVQNRIIGDVWAAGVAALDSNDASVYGISAPGEASIIGVKPVAEDYSALKEAVSQHNPEPKFAAAVDKVVFREDMAEANSLDEAPELLVSPYVFQGQIAKNAIPAFHWSSWNDAGTADGVIARFATGKVKGRFIIGAWSHGAGHDADPFKPVGEKPSPDVKSQYKMIEDFLSKALNSDDQWEAPRVLEYYTMGEAVWKTTDVWPPVGAHTTNLYLDNDFSLAPAAQAGNDGQDDFMVDFNRGTGKFSRWMTQVGGGDIIYPSRDAEASGIISYTGTPLLNDMEITGHVVVSVYASSNDGQGAIYAYLEVVAPDGSVHMVTEGQIRLVHNVTKDIPDSRWVAKPYHSFSNEDKRQVMPDEVVPVTFTMLPTSIRVPKGYKIQVSIAGHDNDAFDPMDKTGPRKITIHRSNIYQSYVSFPIIGETSLDGGTSHE